METQRRYVREGASQTMRSMHRVQADGYGHAVDLGAMNAGKVTWEEKFYYPIMLSMSIAAKELNQDVYSGAFWGSLLYQDATEAAMRRAVQNYVSRKKALREKPFLDFVHFEVR